MTISTTINLSKQAINLIIRLIKALTSLTWYTTKPMLMVIWWACTSILPLAILFFEFARMFKGDAERLD